MSGQFGSLSYYGLFQGPYAGYFGDGGTDRTPPEVPDSLYYNPSLEGGSDIINGDWESTAPDGHPVIYSATADTQATWIGPDDGTTGAFIFNPDGIADVRCNVRLVFGTDEANLTTVEVGKAYRFQAEVHMAGYDDGVTDPQALRGITINNNDALVVDRDNADHSGQERWELVWVDFLVIGESSSMYAHHGLGVSNLSNMTQRTRNLSIVEIEVENPPEWDDIPDQEHDDNEWPQTLDLSDYCVRASNYNIVTPVEGLSIAGSVLTADALGSLPDDYLIEVSATNTAGTEEQAFVWTRVGVVPTYDLVPIEDTKTVGEVFDFEVTNVYHPVIPVEDMFIQWLDDAWGSIVNTWPDASFPTQTSLRFTAIEEEIGTQEIRSRVRAYEAGSGGFVVSSTVTVEEAPPGGEYTLTMGTRFEGRRGWHENQGVGDLQPRPGDFNLLEVDDSDASVIMEIPYDAAEGSTVTMTMPSIDVTAVLTRFGAANAHRFHNVEAEGNAISAALLGIPDDETALLDLEWDITPESDLPPEWDDPMPTWDEDDRSYPIVVPLDDHCSGADIYTKVDGTGEVDSGAGTAELIADQEGDTYSLQILGANDSGSVEGVIEWTVNETPPDIDTQPVDDTGNVGSPIQFTCEGSHPNTDTLIYSWFAEISPGSGTWELIGVHFENATGGSSPTVTITPVEAELGPHNIRCNVRSYRNSFNNELQSDVAELMVDMPTEGELTGLQRLPNQQGYARWGVNENYTEGEWALEIDCRIDALPATMTCNIGCIGWTWSTNGGGSNRLLLLIDPDQGVFVRIQDADYVHQDFPLPVQPMLGQRHLIRVHHNDVDTLTVHLDEQLIDTQSVTIVHHDGATNGNVQLIGLSPNNQGDANAQYRVYDAKFLSGGTPIHYPLEEGEGTIAADVEDGRDMTINNPDGLWFTDEDFWYIDPN